MSAQGRWLGQWPGDWFGPTEGAPPGSLSGTVEIVVEATATLTATGWISGDVDIVVEASATQSGSAVVSAPSMLPHYLAALGRVRAIRGDVEIQVEVTGALTAVDHRARRRRERQFLEVLGHIGVEDEITA